ncbi:MAG: TetR/AcrR family transcriptional regulator [Anaerolineae bacterium]|nr:TetR/AcrR family transcriptional regulator [Anaerolineae bacterium]MDW8067848.1 TetR/AcrR family transcriptional regulator [Anaerolineae bacterium]
MRSKAEETRERILAAAEECFARQGYEATGVAAICQRAGVSKGAFFHHFPTKQAVFLALLERWLTGLEQQLEELRHAAPTIPEAMLRMAAMARQVFEVARGRLPIFLEFLSQAAHDPKVWQATITPYRRYRVFFARLMEAGVAEGSLRPIDPEVAAHAILSMAIGLVLQATVDPDGADWGQVVYQSIQMVLEGIG